MATVAHGARTDEEIQRAVLNELRFEPRVQPNEIGVAVKDGVVTLTGWWIRTRRSGPPRRRRIACAAYARWRTTSKCGCPPRSAELDAHRFQVEVDGSRVILKGTVRSWAERDEAERPAWAAPGVTAVEDRITISL